MRLQQHYSVLYYAGDMHTHVCTHFTLRNINAYACGRGVMINNILHTSIYMLYHSVVLELIYVDIEHARRFN